MPIQQLTSSANPRLRAAVKLRDGRARRKQGRFLIDGWRETLRALQTGYVPREIFFCDQHLPELEHWMRQPQLGSTSVFQLPGNLMRLLAYGQREDDVVAVCDIPEKPLSGLELKPNPLIAVLDGIEKPGNIGAIFRTADAVGVDAVLLADCAGDQFNPNAIRASSGTVFSVPSAIDSAASVIDYLSRHNIRILATRVDADATHWDSDWSGGVALVIGNEAHGISQLWRKANIQGIRIPMAGIADSLNASITAAICLYEAARNRRLNP